MDDEKRILEQAVVESRLMADMMQHHERENKRLWCVIIVLTVCLAAIAGCAIWAVQWMSHNAQEIANAAMLNALNTVAEIEIVEETTTQTVEGDSATINNGNWEQFNDSAVKNGGGE